MVRSRKGRGEERRERKVGSFYKEEESKGREKGEGGVKDGQKG